jgi:hypothetical protein
MMNWQLCFKEIRGAQVLQLYFGVFYSSHGSELNLLPSDHEAVIIANQEPQPGSVLTLNFDSIISDPSNSNDLSIDKQI